MPRARGLRKLVSRPRLLLGPEPEPLWQRLTSDTRGVTEVIYSASAHDPSHLFPSRPRHILELVVNGQRRDLRVFATKREALAQGMAWYRQYESPYHRLALRLHVPDAIARRGVLGVTLPANGQGLVCELFAFHNGQRWQVLVNADARPLLTREYRTEAAAMLDAWGLAWKLQGHALPWPAPWLPTPSIVVHAMERYERVPTITPSSTSRPTADADGHLSADESLPDLPPAADGVPKHFRLLHFAPVPYKVVRRRRPLRDL